MRNEQLNLDYKINFLYSVKIEKKTELAEISIKAQVPHMWIYFSLRMRECIQGMK